MIAVPFAMTKISHTNVYVYCDRYISQPWSMVNGHNPLPQRLSYLHNRHIAQYA